MQWQNAIQTLSNILIEVFPFLLLVNYIFGLKLYARIANISWLSRNKF